MKSLIIYIYRTIFFQHNLFFFKTRNKTIKKKKSTDEFESSLSTQQKEKKLNKNQNNRMVRKNVQIKYS
jgi:hypothetical protein